MGTCGDDRMGHVQLNNSITIVLEGFNMYRSVSKVVSRLTIIVSIFCGALPAMAERYALLIGVSDYEVTPSSAIDPLEGPRNDVHLLYNALRDHWDPSASIKVLADGIEKSAYGAPFPRTAPPTRNAILAALEELAETARKGDEVIVYFSGHGAQLQERQMGSEPDGLDEFFLPIDFKVDAQEGSDTVSIKNHILDDEIGSYLKAIISKGASVWLIADTCHSGSLNRAGLAGAKSRFVSLSSGNSKVIDLNDYENAVEKGESITSDSSNQSIDLGQTMGGHYVGFFASPPDQRSYEYRLPSTAPKNEQRVHGLLTWELVRAIRKGTAQTFGHLARTITNSYLQWGNGQTRAVFAGSLGTEVFLENKGEPYWTMNLSADEQFFVEAGVLHGVHEGAIFSVALHGDETDSAPLFYARVIESGFSKSRLEIVRSEPKMRSRVKEAVISSWGTTSVDQLTLDRWLKDNVGRFEAKLESRAIPFALRVSKPVIFGNSDPAALQKVNRVLSEVRDLKQSQGTVAFELVTEADRADTRLVVSHDRVWFVPDLATFVTSGTGQPRSLAIDGLAKRAFAAELRQIASARNLVRAAAHFDDTEMARGLSVRVSLVPRSPINDVGDCPETKSDMPKVVRGFSDTSLEPIKITLCDIVHVDVRNSGGERVDVSPFYFSSISNYEYLDGYENGPYGGLAIDSGGTERFSFVQIKDGDYYFSGDMRLLLIAVEGGEYGAYDFRHLAQAKPTGSMAPRGVNVSKVFDEAVFGTSTARNSIIDGDGFRSGTLIINLESSDEY